MPVDNDELKHLLELVPEPVFRIGPDGDFVYCNKAWYDLTGLDAAQAGPGWRKLLQPDSVADLEALLALARRSAGRIAETFRLRQEDGTIRTFHVRAERIERADGTFDGVLGTIHERSDPAQLVETREELERLAVRYRDLVEHVPVGVFHGDVQGKNATANKLWLELTGVPRDRLKTVDWRDYIHPDDVPEA